MKCFTSGMKLLINNPSSSPSLSPSSLSPPSLSPPTAGPVHPRVQLLCPQLRHPRGQASGLWHLSAQCGRRRVSFYTSSFFIVVINYINIIINIIVVVVVIIFQTNLRRQTVLCDVRQLLGELCGPDSALTQSATVVITFAVFFVLFFCFCLGANMFLHSIVKV